MKQRWFSGLFAAFLIGLVGVVLFAMCTYAGATLEDVRAAEDVGYGRVNQGDIVWMATLSQGETVIVAYEYYGMHAYVTVSVTPDPFNPDGTIKYLFQLEDVPKQLVITGNQRTISIAAAVPDEQILPVYLYTLVLDTAGVIDGTKSTVYIPLVEK